MFLFGFLNVYNFRKFAFHLRSDCGKKCISMRKKKLIEADNRNKKKWGQNWVNFMKSKKNVIRYSIWTSIWSNPLIKNLQNEIKKMRTKMIENRTHSLWRNFSAKLFVLQLFMFMQSRSKTKIEWMYVNKMRDSWHYESIVLVGWLCCGVFNVETWFRASESMAKASQIGLYIIYILNCTYW